MTNNNWSIAALRIHILAVRARKEWLAPMSWSEYNNRLKRN